MISFDGLATGIDTTSIINSLVAIQQRQIDQLTSRRTGVTTEQSAFKGLEAQLIEFRASLGRLSRTQNNIFSSRTAVSSDSDAVDATASNGAALGVYSLTVNSLAKAHQVAAQGMASADAEITQGTFSFQVGNGTTTSVTIDGTNNTLQGLADAINNADAGVSATIIKDGSGGGTPYRLMLTSNSTGTDSAITITNGLAASSGSAVKPDFTGAAVQAAANASITLGSGVGAITVESATNQIDDVIDGVTLDLKSADPTKALNVTVGRDTEAASTAVSDFVDSFNSVMSYIDSQVSFDAESNKAGALLGNSSVTGIQDELRRTALSVIGGVNSSLNRLQAIGVSVSDAGHLVFNASQLDDALNGRIEGVGERDLTKLFGLSGESTNSGIRFLIGSTRTKESTSPVEIDITQAAERASITASSTLAASTVIDGTNNQFTITVDGATSETLTLASGTYTRQELADHLQTVINESEELKNRSVAVTLSSDALQVTSDSYGFSSEVKIGSGTAVSALGFAGTENDRGQDVVGKFIVNGVEEIAKGTGQVLAGDPDNENTADLQVRVTLTPSQIVAGVDAEMTVTRGVASKLDQFLGRIMDPVTGRFKTINDGFTDRIESIDETIDRYNSIIETRRDALLKQFAALEGNVSRLNSTSSFLAAQLSGVNSLVQR